MKNIQLFHSYNYVNGTFRQHNKDIYDDHNTLLFSLLNIPNNSDLYTIKIQRILKKKSFSLKKNNNSYYTKHNLKVFLVINYVQLNIYISKHLEIPHFRLLYNIIINNSYINKNEYVHNLICFNKSFNKKILNKHNTIINNFNFYDLGDLKLDMLNRTIISGGIIKGKISNEELGAEEKRLRSLLTKQYRNEPQKLVEEYRKGMENLQKKYI